MPQQVTTSRFDQMLSMTIAGLESATIQHMPPGAYQDYCLWALSPANSNRMAWLQVMGVLQTVRLTEKLLEGVANDQEWAGILQASVPLNVYLTFEVISDNLAIGLAVRQPEDRFYAIRRDLLSAFNQAVIARLSGAPHDTKYLLTKWQDMADRISSFTQSLSPSKHRALAEPYLSGRAPLTLADVEYGIWPGLIANAEACIDAARAVAHFKTRSLIVQGFLDRYYAVNALLGEPDMPPARRAHLGAHAILVSPVVAYYLAVFAEWVRPLAGFAEVVEDNTLESALYDAAILVRLLNDLGTGLLTQAGERAAMMRALDAEANDHTTLSDLILQAANHFPLLTRIHKDTYFGEFNIGLHGIESLKARSALPVFESRLAHYHALYAETSVHLNEVLTHIDERLGDRTISELIARFVQFHVSLYSQAHQKSAGEYAV